MPWADRLRRLLAPAHSPRNRTRLAVRPLEDRTVPAAIPLGPTGPNPPLPQLGDRVWRDLNANGLQDPGEPGIPFATLRLYKGDTLVGTTSTDGNGTYWFNRWNVTNGTPDPADDGLQPNTAYQVRIAGDQPALVGLRPTAADQGTDDLRDSDAVTTATGAVINLTTTADEIFPQYDAGYVPAATIGNLVWLDANNNGRKDPTEAGIPGVTVRLLDSNGAQVATTTTGADGSYLFTGLVPGTYVVEIAAGNFTPSGALVGTISSTGRPGQTGGPVEGLGTPDPDTVHADGTDVGTMENGVVRCKPVTVGATALTNRAVDFGFFQSSSLAGRVFLDKNSNGRIDPEDATGLAGVKVRAAGPAGVFVATTDDTGAYRFDGLPAGAYTVTKVSPPAGYKSTTPNLVRATLTSGATATVDFGEATTVDLRVTESATATVFGVGGTVILTYRVKNLGTQDATGVVLWAPVPIGFRYVGSKGAGATYDPATQRATVGTLAAGAEVTVRVWVQATQQIAAWARATVQGAEPEDNVANNSTGLVLTALSAGAVPLGPQGNTSPVWLS